MKNFGKVLKKGVKKGVMFYLEGMNRTSAMYMAKSNTMTLR